MWTKLGALLASPLQGKFLEMQFLFVKMKVIESRALEGCLPPAPSTEKASHEEAITGDLCPPPSHSSLTNVKKK